MQVLRTIIEHLYYDNSRIIYNTYIHRIDNPPINILTSCISTL